MQAKTCPVPVVPAEHAPLRPPHPHVVAHLGGIGTRVARSAGHDARISFVAWTVADFVSRPGLSGSLRQSRQIGRIVRRMTDRAVGAHVTRGDRASEVESLHAR